MSGSLLTQYARQFIGQLPMAVVVFDHRLCVMDRNPAADLLLDRHETVPGLLAGAEPPAGSDWAGLLEAVLCDNQTRSFDRVVCHRSDRDQILKLVCIPMRQAEQADSAGGWLVVEDVTRQALMARDLAHAERLAALGKLSAKVAHELNNPLDGIIRYLNLAIRLAGQQENLTLLKYLKESHYGLLRMVRILGEMLDFSRETRSSFEPADINKLVEDAVRALDLKADEFDVEIVCDYQDSMPNVRSGNLYQVFCNLIKNAIEAMPGGGRLFITTVTDAAHAIIRFCDSGDGIAAEALPRIFEPFFTTKENGQGTGLGLSICRDIVERHGGRLTVANNSERGCTFTVTIPLAQTSWSDQLPA